MNEGRGDHIAMVYESAYTLTTVNYTYSDLLDKVCRLARIFVDTFGIEVGDRVMIFMPMVPEVAFSMLA